MSIFNLLTLLGGIALFLYGMKMMGSGLEKVTGGKLESLLERLTSNRFKGVLLGAGVTAVIQASGATTVMLVGFVNSGIMKLSQAIGIIMGANIGTTATGWLLSLSGIESDNFFVQLLKPSSFAPVLAFAGLIMIMLCKKGKKKEIGAIILGFGMLMIGMGIMQTAVEPLSGEKWFADMILMFSNPVLGVLVGAVMTAILQSSSAAVGVLQAVSNATGALTYSSAMPMIMGQNIGTCSTALISSIGANKSAKRVAIVHLFFNVIGTAIFLTVFYLIEAFIGFTFMDDQISAVGIATVHTIFNLVTTAILLPFTKQLERLANFVIKDKPTDKSYETPILDERFLNTPSYAAEQCKSMAVRMANLSMETMIKAMDVIKNYDPKQFEEVIENENIIDIYEDKLGTYLVKLGAKDLTAKDNKLVSMLLHSIGDFERISDHAVNVVEAAQEMYEKQISFSPEAKQEVTVISDAIAEILNTSMKAFEDGNVALAKTVEPLEEVVDNLRNELKNRHIQRLRDGRCTIELGFILSDLLTNYERVSDHCSNIAVCLIQIRENNMDAHEYINELKKADESEFMQEFEVFRSKYVLP